MWRNKTKGETEPQLRRIRVGVAKVTAAYLLGLSLPWQHKIPPKKNQAKLEKPPVSRSYCCDPCKRQPISVLTSPTCDRLTTPETECCRLVALPAAAAAAAAAVQCAEVAC